MIEIVGKKKIFSNKQHNALTDLIYFKDRYYLAFRQGSFHTSFEGNILISTSKDGEKWTKPKNYFSTNYDDRDPKLFIFKKKLFCIFGNRINYKNKIKIFPKICWTSDGKIWSRPRKFYKENWFPSRPKVLENKIYLSCYNTDKIKFSQWQSLLLKSSDAKTCQKLSLIFKGAVTETELHFFNKENLIAVLRREREKGLIAFSSPPYKKWEYKEIPEVIHCPTIKVINKKLILVAREYKIGESEISLWEWNEENFVKSLILDSGMDCAYCGIEEDVKNKEQAFVSYYSGSHKKADIYLAKIKVG